jgi:NurA-like 5'-3' nuclease
VKKYPFESYEELLNYASDEEKEQFKELNKQINETEDENERAALEASRDEFYWKCYLEYIHNNDPQLAEILADLYANNFDFSTLNQNPASRDYLLSELANYRFNQLKE